MADTDDASKGRETDRETSAQNQLRKQEIEIAQRQMENDFTVRMAQIDLQKSEQELRRKEGGWRSSPLSVAVIGAAIAGLANAFVGLRNNNTMLDIETLKENHEKQIEMTNAEFSRLLEVTRL